MTTSLYDVPGIKTTESEMELIFDMCTECCRPPLPTIGLKYKRTVLIFLFCALLVIDVSASLIKCYSDRDCNRDQCCVGYYQMNEVYTKCKSKVPRNLNCNGWVKRKFIPLPNGRLVFDRCGCNNEDTCMKIKRKNWKKKKQFWSRTKKRMKTPYKYRCRYLPPEPEEKS